VEALDPLGGDFFGASSGAFKGIAASAEAFGVHLGDHIKDAIFSFGLSLWHKRQVTDLCGDKEHRRGIFAGSNTSATTDAKRGFKGFASDIFGDQDGVPIGGIPDVDGDITASLLDAVKGGAIHGEVFDDGECGGAPRLKDEGIAIFETAKVKLTGGGFDIGAMRLTVDDKATGSTDPFAAIVFEGNGVFAFGDELVVEDIKHLKHRHIGGEIFHLMCLKLAFGFGIGLTPDVEGQADILFGHYL
jgi:hypothetical protein